MLSLSFFLDDVPKPNQPIAYLIHKSFGLTVLGLMIFRFAFLLFLGKPRLPHTVPLWQKIAARTVQYSLYVFLLAQPLSGWIMSVAEKRTPVFFGLFPVPLPIAPNKALGDWMSQAHTIIAWILIGLIVLHIAGALKHYLIDKDKVLQSMLPQDSKDNPIASSIVE